MGCLLVLTILLPSIVQLSHLYEEHNHVVCFNDSLHVHEKIQNCDIQDFHLTSFNFEPKQNIENTDFIIPNFINSIYHYLPYKTHDHSINNLRAPPFLS